MIHSKDPWLVRYDALMAEIQDRIVTLTDGTTITNYAVINRDRANAALLSGVERVMVGGEVRTRVKLFAAYGMIP